MALENNDMETPDGLVVDLKKNSKAIREIPPPPEIKPATYLNYEDVVDFDEIPQQQPQTSAEKLTKRSQSSIRLSKRIKSPEKKEEK